MTRLIRRLTTATLRELAGLFAPSRPNLRRRAERAVVESCRRCGVIEVNELRLEPAEVVLVSNREPHLRAAVQAGLSTIAIACPHQVPADLHLEVFTDLQCERAWRSYPRYVA